MKQSLWVYLFGLPASFEAQIFYALMLAGSLGMFANYVVKWARNEIAGSLALYLFVTNPRATLLSFCLFTGLCISAVGSGFFIVQGDVFIGWGAVLWLGASNGFAIDAIVNKGQRPVWSAADRASKLEQEKS